MRILQVALLAASATALHLDQDGLPYPMVVDIKENRKLSNPASLLGFYYFPSKGDQVCIYSSQIDQDYSENCSLKCLVNTLEPVQQDLDSSELTCQPETSGLLAKCLIKNCKNADILDEYLEKCKAKESFSNKRLFELLKVESDLKPVDEDEECFSLDDIRELEEALTHLTLKSSKPSENSIISDPEHSPLESPEEEQPRQLRVDPMEELVDPPVEESQDEPIQVPNEEEKEQFPEPKPSRLNMHLVPLLPEQQILRDCQLECVENTKLCKETCPKVCTGDKQCTRSCVNYCDKEWCSEKEIQRCVATKKGAKLEWAPEISPAFFEKAVDDCLEIGCSVTKMTAQSGAGRAWSAEWLVSLILLVL